MVPNSFFIVAFLPPGSVQRARRLVFHQSLNLESIEFDFKVDTFGLCQLFYFGDNKKTFLPGLVDCLTTLRVFPQVCLVLGSDEGTQVIPIPLIFYFKKTLWQFSRHHRNPWAIRLSKR